MRRNSVLEGLSERRLEIIQEETLDLAVADICIKTRKRNVKLDVVSIEVMTDRRVRNCIVLRGW